KTTTTPNQRIVRRLPEVAQLPSIVCGQHRCRGSRTLTATTDQLPLRPAAHHQVDPAALHQLVIRAEQLEAALQNARLPRRREASPRDGDLRTHGVTGADRQVE